MKIVGLGDSNTWGYPEGPDHSWLSILGERMACQVFNRGITGAGLSYMRTKIPQVIADQPDIVIITGGTNDAFDRLSVERVGSEFKAIFDEVRENTTAIIVIGLPIPLNYSAEGRHLDGYRGWMREFATENKCLFIDFYSALLDPHSGQIQAEYNFDDIHPNQRGYERMAEEAYRVLKGLNLHNLLFLNTCVDCNI